MNDRETLDVQLNAMSRFDPNLPEACRRSPYVFLANGSTDIQLKVLEQCRARGWSWPTPWTSGSARSGTCSISFSSVSTGWCSTTAKRSS